MAFNKLTDAQAERLAILSEEMGEAIHAIGKIQRHGLESYNPFHAERGSNRKQLAQELGHVVFAINALCKAGDVDHEVLHIAEKE